MGSSKHVILLHVPDRIDPQMQGYHVDLHYSSASVSTLLVGLAHIAPLH